MKISDILKREKPTLSFEVFPPKTTESFESVEAAAVEIGHLKPDFMSVTYGATGGRSQHTFQIASDIQNACGVPVLAHLTCVSSSPAEIQIELQKLSEKKIENVLALRGDIPPEMESIPEGNYRYASDLVHQIKAFGEFCIGGACYPEGHVEAKNKEDDLIQLKKKVDAGCDFLTTQMFFDNNILYSFLYRLREKGITTPIIAGIMPVTNGKQIERIIRLSGACLPARFKAIIDKFGDKPNAMKQAGIAYATEQIIDLLANGVRGIHVYTMNKPDIAASIRKNLSEIL